MQFIFHLSPSGIHRHFGSRSAVHKWAEHRHAASAPGSASMPRWTVCLYGEGFGRHRHLRS